MAILGTSEAAVLGLTFAAIALAHYVKQAKANANRKLPPGPKGVPFFGNLFQIDVLRPYPKVRFSYTMDSSSESSVDN
jgi:hypothetical protein